MKMNRKGSRVVSPTYHLTVIFSISVFVSIVVMSYLFQIEIVAQGIGKVIPIGRVQIIQSESGGQIQKIFVRDGSLVTKGDVLIALDSTNAQAEVNTLQDEISRLEIELYRIEVFSKIITNAENVTPDIASRGLNIFSQKINDSNLSFPSDQIEILKAELTELVDLFKQIDAKIEANNKSKNVTRATISRIEAAIGIQQERLQNAENLLQKGATSYATYLNVLDSFTQLQKEREIYLNELEQKSALEPVYNAEKASILSAKRALLLNQKTKTTGQLHKLQEQLTSKERWLANSLLKSPVDGTVDKLSVFTVGGVVSAGQELMRIVPQSNKLEVEAIFPNIDVGFLKRGQLVNIKLDAFPSERFGMVQGVVSNVSADAVEIGKNNYGYIVRIKPDTPYLETPSNRYPLRVGMTSTVDAITGKRRLISYFFAPIVKVIQESLRER